VVEAEIGKEEALDDVKIRGAAEEGVTMIPKRASWASSER